jgi:putative NADPH-quinone reductase
MDSPCEPVHHVNISVILAHPTPGSLNHAIAAAVSGWLAGLGHSVALHDLYAEGFDPILPGTEIPKGAPVDETVAGHCREIREADGIVIVHPNWWGQPPAILTGWIDRVMRPGVAYEFLDGDGGEGVPVGLLKARTGLVLNTSNTPTHRESQTFGDPLEHIWKKCIFDLCGVKDVRRVMFSVVATSSTEERHAWLESACLLAEGCFPRE